MDKIVPVGHSRFLYYLQKAQHILDGAAQAESPALFAYTENLRTPFFMLEALTRIYKKIHNKKKFSRLNKWFKSMEDGLGSIDFYDGFYKEFAADTHMPPEITGYLKKCRDKKIKELDTVLRQKGWLHKGQRFRKILHKLENADWLSPEKDLAAIREAYRDDVSKIIMQYGEEKHVFTDIETGVHEFRRQLRWLSIYAQALQGAIQLDSRESHEDYFSKYLTPAILQSPYNKMPDGSALADHIFLNSNCFYALSWMIDRLGILKDNGLRISAVEEGLLARYQAQGDITSLAMSLCGADQPSVADILKEAQEITGTFFREHILENIFT